MTNSYYVHEQLIYMCKKKRIFRQCHLVCNQNYDYGFNLKSRNECDRIGRVEYDSPAHSAGLKENDRIIQINGINIINEGYESIVDRIKRGVPINDDDELGIDSEKSLKNEVKLLVTDRAIANFIQIIKEINENGCNIYITLTENQHHQSDNTNSHVTSELPDELKQNCFKKLKNLDYLTFEITNERVRSTRRKKKIDYYSVRF
jgi:C-terminal processing protease CtpA/Prc